MLRHIFGYVITVSISTLVWYLFEQLGTEAALFSLLAITTQILVAIMAIVFSLALLAAQFASRFSFRIIDQVFGRQTFCYMSIFIGTVLVSFILLTTKETFLVGTYVIFIEIALVLTTACIVYLPFYLFQVKEWLKIRNLCKYLTAKGESAILEADIVREVDQVQALCELALNLNAGKSYEDLSSSIEALRNLMIFAIKRGKTKIAVGIIHKVGDIAWSMLYDVEGARRIVANFGRFISIETNQTPNVEQELKEKLNEIIKEVVDQRGLVAKRVIYELGGLGGDLAAKHLDGSNWVLNRLQGIGKDVIEKKLDKLALQTIGATYWIGKIAIDKATTQDELRSVRMSSIATLQSHFYQAMKNNQPNRASDANFQIRKLQKAIANREFDEKYYSGDIALKDLEFGQEDWFNSEIGYLQRAAATATDKGLVKVTECIIEALSNISCNPKNMKFAMRALKPLAIIISWAASNPKLYDRAKIWVNYLVKVGEETQFDIVTAYTAEQAFFLCVEVEKPLGKPLDLPREFCIETINQLKAIKSKINLIDLNADGAFHRVRERVEYKRKIAYGELKASYEAKLALLDDLKALYEAP